MSKRIPIYIYPHEFHMNFEFGSGVIFKERNP